MSSDPIWPSILILLILLVFYALCSACETAIDAIGETGRARLEERDDRRSARLLKILDAPEGFHTALRLVALAAETAWFVYGSYKLYPLFPLSTGGAIALSALILAALLWLFGRMFPTQIALQNPEGVALSLCGPFRAIAIVVSPITALFLLVARGLLFIFRIKPRKKQEDVSEGEIRAMVDIGQESGAIEEDEKQMIENVFEFNNLTAEDIMTHRTNMEMISLSDTDEKILNQIESTGLSRFPVYRQDADDIIGILSAKDYLLNQQKESPKLLIDLLRRAYFVPESVRADILFQDMQSKSLQMAIVVDEYGGTSGLVTMEDLLEQLVGNMYDEFDPKEVQEIVPIEDNLWHVAGSVDLETLGETLNMEFPEENQQDTLGGLVFSCLPVIPEDGAKPKVEALGLSIQVEVLSDRRVEWALVSRLPEEEEEDKTED